MRETGVLPFSYTIDAERGVVYTTASGVLTLDDWLAYDEELSSDPAFDPSFDQLADFTQMTEAKISASERRRVAEASPFGRGSRRAAITSADWVFGLGRVYEAYSRGEAEIRIFRSVDEARDWLGLPGPAPQEWNGT